MMNYFKIWCFLLEVVSIWELKMLLLFKIIISNKCNKIKQTFNMILLPIIILKISNLLDNIILLIINSHKILHFKKITKTNIQYRPKILIIIIMWIKMKIKLK